MERLMIRGGKPLRGSVEISGAKNSAVALIPCALLAHSPVILDNLPHIQDVAVYEQLLKELGAEVDWEGNSILIDPSRLKWVPIPNGKVKMLRASYYLMGALLGRFGQAVVGLPGGCNLGPRPIDQHIKGFEAMGAEVTFQSGALNIQADHLRGARIYLDVVSVGATINIMLAAACADGVTVIENAAKEPEIVDVATLINSMGGKVSGAGTDVVKVEGVRQMHGCRHDIIPDRIEAGTYLIAAAATGGDIWVNSCIPEHLEPTLAKLKEVGLEIDVFSEQVHLYAKRAFQATDIKTLPYPGFPTDLQQPMSVLLTQAEGNSMVTENIYASRFKHIEEMIRMGASMQLEGRTVIIEGKTPLFGAQVQAMDLRAGAALVIGGLVAEGATEIIGIEHIDRGYERMEEKLANLGAVIWRTKM